MLDVAGVVWRLHLCLSAWTQSIKNGARDRTRTCDLYRVKEEAVGVRLTH